MHSYRAETFCPIRYAVVFDVSHVVSRDLPRPPCLLVPPHLPQVSPRLFPSSLLPLRSHGTTSGNPGRGADPRRLRVKWEEKPREMNQTSPTFQLFLAAAPGPYLPPFRRPLGPSSGGAGWLNCANSGRSDVTDVLFSVQTRGRSFEKRSTTWRIVEIMEKKYSEADESF